jgi:hypothetical protein
MADHDGTDWRTAESAIRAACEAEVSGTCPPEAPAAPRPGDKPNVSGEPTSGFEPLTPSLRVKCSTS